MPDPRRPPAFSVCRFGPASGARKTVERERQPLPDGLLAGKQLSRQRLRKHDDGRGAGAVLARDASPSQRGGCPGCRKNAHPRASCARETACASPSRKTRVVLWRKSSGIPSASGHRGDTGRLSEVLRQLLAAGTARSSRRRSSAAGKIHARREQTDRLEADVRGGGRADLIELHAADDEERHGDSRLNRGRPSMQPAHPSSSPAGIVFQRRHQVRPAEPDRRQQAEHQRRDEAQADARSDTSRHPA